MITETLHSFTFGGRQLFVNPTNLQTSEDPSTALGGAPRTLVRQRSATSYLTLHLTQACNLSCSYCFGAHLHGGLMPLDTGSAAIDFVFGQSDQDIAFRFFGGEPLLAFDLIKRLVAYALEKRAQEGNLRQVSFNIFTNAVNLTDEQVAFFKEHRFSVFVSLDGPEVVHNRYRRMRNGSGTFDKVFNHARWLASELPHRVLIRSVLDPSSDDSLVDIAEALFATGATFVSFTLPWVASDSPFALTPSRVERLRTEVDALAHWYLNNITRDRRLGYLGLHPFNKIIIKAMHQESPLEVHACGAGVEGAAVSTDGRLYPCHAFVGYPQFEMGGVWGLSPGGAAIRNSFVDYGAETVRSCKECWARNLCTARCPADSFFFSGEIHEMNGLRCHFYRRVYEAGLAINYILTHDHPREYKIIERLIDKKERIIGAH